jgi:hypothetical protein
MQTQAADPIWGRSGIVKQADRVKRGNTAYATGEIACGAAAAVL